jgi:CheY-like chemotaxis protein
MMFDSHEEDLDLRVLVVEDQPDSLDLLLAMLSFDGFRCVGAETAEEALDLLRTDSFALVVTDHNLPAMSGTEMLARAFDDGLLDPARAVMCTGCSFLLPPDGVTVLRKPISFDRLREVVSAALTTPASRPK